MLPLLDTVSGAAKGAPGGGGEGAGGTGGGDGGRGGGLGGGEGGKGTAIVVATVMLAARVPPACSTRSLMREPLAVCARIALARICMNTQQHAGMQPRSCGPNPSAGNNLQLSGMTECAASLARLPVQGVTMHECFEPGPVHAAI